MSIDLSKVTGISDSHGAITEIKDSLGRVIWAASGGKVILEVEKITSNTYAGETTYENEQFILLDIYPKTNGTVKVTYGGLTKTITDTSGAAEPNAQQVFFGTFNGVSDSVATPASGELTIEGEYYAFGAGAFSSKSKDLLQPYCFCVVEIKSFGEASYIPEEAITGLAQGIVTPKFNQANLEIPSTIKSIGKNAFYNCASLLSVDMQDGVETLHETCFFSCSNLRNVVLPKSVKKIGDSAFYTASLKSVKIQATTPPELVENISSTDGTTSYKNFGDVEGESFGVEQIIVPKGCGNTYKTAAGWSTYADYIVEES